MKAWGEKEAPEEFLSPRASANYLLGGASTSRLTHPAEG